MKEGTYFTVQAFMRNELNLKGNELLVYAVIFGFSQDGESGFEGSYSYIMDAIGSTKQTVINSVNILVERGLVRKDVLRKNGVDYYRIACTPLLGIVPSKGQEEEQKKVTEVETRPAKRFEKPTIEEVRAYCRDRGNDVDAEQFVNFYEAKGWKVGNQPMKDWKAAVRTWEKRDSGNGTKVSDRKLYDSSKWDRKRKGGDPKLWED